MLNHHAYYIEDSLAQAGAYKEAIRAREGFLPHDQKFIVRSYEKFGIDEARELQNLSSLKATEGTTLFFISLSSITSEAQQALLKLFEEPQAGLVFILLLPHGMLLPTLRSRFLEYPHTLHEKPLLLPEAQMFLSLSYKARSDWLTKFLKGEEENTRQQAREFVDALEVALYPHIKENRDAREGLADIAHFRQYLSDRSPSLKMILEHLAATLPQVAAKTPEKSVRSGPLGQV